MSLTGFPWARVMELGLGVLKLSPDAFWSMTLVELAAAMRVHVPMALRDEGMTQARLNELKAKYPDQPQQEK